MTNPPPSEWKVVAHPGGPKDYWRLIASGNEGNATATFRANLTAYSDLGGLRLLDAEGHCQRFAGPLGRISKENP